MLYVFLFYIYLWKELTVSNNFLFVFSFRFHIASPYVQSQSLFVFIWHGCIALSSLLSTEAPTIKCTFNNDDYDHYDNDDFDIVSIFIMHSYVWTYERRDNIKTE